MVLIMVLDVLNYIPQRICISSYCLINQMEENGMFSGDSRKLSDGLDEYIKH